MSNATGITAPQPAKEPGAFTLIATLGIAGFLSGVVLVTAYLYTKPLIAANRKAALEKAIYKVLPECTSYRELELRDGKLSEPVQGKGGKAAEATGSIYLGFNDSGEVTGFAIPGAEPGFQDIIGVLFGFDPAEKVIVGFEVLESKETPGLGDKIFKDAGFQANFRALSVEPEIIPVKKDAKTNPNEVETITGATISSKAVVRLLNKAVKEWKTAMEAYMKEHPAAKTPVRHEGRKEK